MKQVCRTFCFPELHEEQPEAIGGGCLEISSDWILHIGYISGNTREHITCFEKPYSMFMVSPLQALMEDQVQYLDSLQRSYQNQIRNHELSMIRTCGQIVTTKKRTLTKFLGVDKHMIPGDPIRGNNDICNNNYLVLYGTRIKHLARSRKTHSAI